MIDDLQPMIADAFLRLVGALEAQPASAWDAPSLCEAWKVHEVVAHMTTAARYRPDAFVAELHADGGDFSQTIDRIAARDGQLDTAILLANLRDALTSGGAYTNFGVNLDGIALRSTDLDWAWGDGEQVTGAATDLALALCGRHLSGKWSPARSHATSARPAPR